MPQIRLPVLRGFLMFWAQLWAQANRVSSLLSDCNFTLYTVLKAEGVVESKHKISLTGTVPAQPF